LSGEKYLNIGIYRHSSSCPAGNRDERMNNKFRSIVPRKPVLRRKTYDLPSAYSDAYAQAGVTDHDEQMMLFHTTQFGGFKIRKIPSSMRFDKAFLDKWFKQDYDNGYRIFRANHEFLSVFGNLEVKPLEKKWHNHVLNIGEMFENGFSNEEINRAICFLEELNKFYLSLRLNIRTLGSGITAEDRIQLSRFNAIPYLVKKAKAGGRFFNPGSSYQRISSPIR